MKRCAVVGHPIAHSVSPKIHQAFAADCHLELSYEKYDCPLDSFEKTVQAFFKAGGWGLNITLPFKERAFLLCDVLTPVAQRAEAVNTFWQKNGRIYGDNTDGIGFRRDLQQWLESVKPKSRDLGMNGKKILILGAGGAVRGILESLLDANPTQCIIANRTMAKALALKNAFPQIHCCPWSDLDGTYDVIINATSTSVTGEALLLPTTIFAAKPFCYDLAYDTTKDTSFVAEAKQHGCMARDGMGMLVEQAAESFYIWHGVRPSASCIQVLAEKSFHSFGRI